MSSRWNAITSWFSAWAVVSVLFSAENAWLMPVVKMIRTIDMITMTTTISSMVKPRSFPAVSFSRRRRAARRPVM